MRIKIFVIIATITVAALGCEKEKPISCFTTSIDNATISDSIIFDLSCSDNPSYNTWDFGDGTIVNSKDLTTIHSYSASGEYIVTLTVCEHAMWYKGKTECDDYSKTIIVAQ